MYRKMEDFQNVWNYEASETLKIFNDLTDESLNQKVTETGRSLGFLAWHIVTTIEEFFGHAGVKIDSAKFGSETPKTVTEIVEGFEKAVKLLNEELPKHWKDENLTDEIAPGCCWQDNFELALVSIRKLKSIAISEQAQLWPNHDMFFFKQLPVFPSGHE